MAALKDKEVLELQALAETYIHATRRTAKINDVLGAGASAAVFDLKDGPERLALKVYSPAFFSDDNGLAERRRLKLQEGLVGHTCPSLVQLFRVTFHENTCFVEMERVAGVDLNKVLSEIPRTSIQPLIRQLVAAVQYLESVGLAHRDIKPHNIRVSSDFKILKLLDLGVVRQLDYDAGPDATAQGPKKPFIATAQYSSPEYLFWLQPPSRDLWRALSIYQVGAVLHDLITRSPLFADAVATENRYALAMAVLQKIPAIDADDVPPWLCALAARCLTKDMTRRLSMVRWDDFQDATGPIANTVRRFQQIRRMGLSVAEDGLKQHERLLRRTELVACVAEQLAARIRGIFEDCQLEHIQDNDLFGLVFRVPNSPLRIDFVVAFRWSEITPEETATVLTYCQLRPESLPYSTPFPTRDACSLAHDGPGTAVTVLLTRFIEQVGYALEVAQLKGGALSAVVSLEKGTP